ncbi:hypothetical protein GCWU000246_01167 [Jonquetella anthropi E3_33 E1]|nr:hypothetical protein GCWU000246_01167 [Jonquetella anthropi E3_33 E1]
MLIKLINRLSALKSFLLQKSNLPSFAPARFGGLSVTKNAAR